MWSKVTSTVHNIIVGKLWIDQVLLLFVPALEPVLMHEPEKVEETCFVVTSVSCLVTVGGH